MGGGIKTHLRYDARNNCTSATDPLGNQTTYVFNIADQGTTTTLPATGNTGVGNAQSLNSYLYPGGPLVQQDAMDESASVVRTVNLTYGAAGETLTRTGSTEPVSLTYTPFYATKTLTDGNSNVTTYTYNTKGQVTQIAYPGSTGTYFDKTQFTSYDNVGNLLTRVDGNGQTTNYTYGDTDGLLSQIAYPSSGYGNVSFSYDGYDRLTSGTDWTGTFGRSYDDLGNVSQATRNYSGISPSTTFTFDYTYYPEGSRETMVNTAGTWTYYRDKNGQCTSMTSPAGTHSIAYLDNGWEDSRTLPNGTSTSYAYNGVGALAGLTNATSGSVTRSSYGSFAYDGVFNMTGVSGSVPPNTNQDRTLSFSYDTKDRVTSDVSSASGITYSYSNSFGYDTGGNPTTFKGTSQSFNSDNQNSGTGFTYDGNGNMTATSAASMTFDPENHMATRTVGTTIFDFTYRADGLRASKLDESVTKHPTFFLYDGGEPVLEVSDTGSVVAKNVFAPDGLVARHNGSSWTYYTFDHQGNVANRENASEAVVNNSIFDAYGRETSDGTPDCWGYNARWGYYHDRDTGLDLYLCQHRYYDQNAGRWINRDPIGYGGGIGLYGYCGSGPTSLIDPSGHGAMGMLGGFVGGITGLILSGGNPFGAIAGAASGYGIGESIDLERARRNGESVSIERELGEAALTLGPMAIAPVLEGESSCSLVDEPFTEEFAEGPDTSALSWDHAPYESRSSYRPRFWKEQASAPGAAEKWGDANIARMKAGKAAQVQHPNGNWYSLELCHEPIRYCEGGRRVVVRSPWEHAELDPLRFWNP